MNYGVLMLSVVVFFIGMTAGMAALSSIDESKYTVPVVALNVPEAPISQLLPTYRLSSVEVTVP